MHTTLLHDKKVAIIGTGNIGESLLRGLLKILKPEQIIITDIREDRIEELMATHKVAGTIDNRQACYDADIILFCIKPQNAMTVLQEIRDAVNEDKLFITVVAGLTFAKIHKVISDKVPMVRSMPNIPCQVNAAATACVRSAACTKTHAQIARAIFESVGICVETAEAKMNVVTALSGSGPAYIYMVIEALIDGAVKMGLERDVALKLTAQTVLGAAKLVLETQLHPAILRERVTTPGGVTISAIHELENHGLRSMLMSAIEIATLKSDHLTEKLSNSDK